MSEQLEESPVATGGREVLVRTFAVQSQSVDGRNLTVRVVPFDEVATVADPPDFKPYQEQFVSGVFDRNEKAPNRVLLRTDHAALDSSGGRKPGLAGVIGRGVNLRNVDSGYEADFRLFDNADAATAREMLSEGVYNGVSAEFMPIKDRFENGIKTRVKAHLDSVALALAPAYSKSEILALREESIMADEYSEFLPPPVNKELIERCENLGVKVPEGMAALLTRAYTEATWDGSASRWSTAAEYCSHSAIDLNPAGKAKTKSLCHLPYKEPGTGTINVNGVRAALARIGQGDPQDASQAQRDAAKSLLERVLASFNSSDNSTPAS